MKGDRKRASTGAFAPRVEDGAGHIVDTKGHRGEWNGLDDFPRVVVHGEFTVRGASIGGQ